MRLRFISGCAFALALAFVAPNLAAFQRQDQDKLVPNGGIFVPGWEGKVDASSAGFSHSVKDAKFEMQGNDIHVLTGPATTYWNPANTASGDYTVKGSFTEPQYEMPELTHPHSYGVAIAGNDMGTAQMSLLYCAVYGDGTFIVRGFGPAAFRMNGSNPVANAAIHKAADKGKPVTNDVAMSVKGDQVSCAINGTVVGTYSKADLVVPGKLKSLDGTYGLRFTHNVEVMIKGFGMTK